MSYFLLIEIGNFGLSSMGSYISVGAAKSFRCVIGGVVFQTPQN